MVTIWATYFTHISKGSRNILLQKDLHPVWNNQKSQRCRKNEYSTADKNGFLFRAISWCHESPDGNEKLSLLETAINVLKPYKYSFVRIDLMGWPVFAFWPYRIRTHHRMKKISPQELFPRPVCSYVHREQLRRLDGISWNCVAYATISHIFSDAQLLVLLFPSFYQLFIIHFCRRLCRHQQLRLES